jgi:hypothetical protein
VLATEYLLLNTAACSAAVSQAGIEPVHLAGDATGGPEDHGGRGSFGAGGVAVQHDVEAG